MIVMMKRLEPEPITAVLVFSSGGSSAGHPAALRYWKRLG